MLKAKRRNPAKIPMTFLHRFDGKVYKVRLLPGQSAEFSEFHYHDEGWSTSQDVLTRLGRDIELTQYTDGRDCDGRLSTHGLARTTHSQLRAREPWCYPGKKPCRDRFPQWSYIDRSQRDYSAEAMGY